MVVCQIEFNKNICQIEFEMDGRLDATLHIFSIFAAAVTAAAVPIDDARAARPLPRGGGRQN